MIKFLHTADWHPRSMGTIGGRLAIDTETGLSRTLTDFQKSLEWITEIMGQEKIRLLFITGDVFDTQSFSTRER